MITTRNTTSNDLETILEVELLAFKGSGIVKRFVTDLLEDPSAAPIVSVLAYDGDKAVGHIMFSKARVKTGCGFCNLKYRVYILAPVAVIPEYQKQGIGGLLIEEGLRILKDMGVERCFVMGYNDFDPKHGFNRNATKAGWPTPFPIPDEMQNAWMWRDLMKDPEEIKGLIMCSNTLMQKKYWRGQQ